MLDIRPISLAEANAFVEEHHRHHKPVVGHKFSIGRASSVRKLSLGTGKCFRANTRKIKPKQPAWGYVPHWATYPHANRFKTGGRK